MKRSRNQELIDFLTIHYPLPPREKSNGEIWYMKLDDNLTKGQKLAALPDALSAMPWGNKMQSG